MIAPMQWNHVAGVDIAEDPTKLSEHALVALISKSAHAEQGLVHVGSLKGNALHGVGILLHHKAPSFSHVE